MTQLPVLKPKEVVAALENWGSKNIIKKAAI